MVSVFAIGPKVCGFNPGRRRWIFKEDKNLQHVFLRRRRKPFGTGQNSSFPSPVTPAFYQIALLVRLPESSDGRIRSLFLSINSTMISHAHISLGSWETDPMVAAVQRRTLKPSTRSSSSLSSTLVHRSFATFNRNSACAYSVNLMIAFPRNYMLQEFGFDFLLFKWDSVMSPGDSLVKTRWPV
jgi:hypothetical protein